MRTQPDASYGYILSSGVELSANQGFLGINSELRLSEGYDGSIEIFSFENGRLLSPSEVSEIADYVIGLWQQLKVKYGLGAPEE